MRIFHLMCHVLKQDCSKSSYYLTLLEIVHRSELILLHFRCFPLPLAHVVTNCNS